MAPSLEMETRSFMAAIVPGVIASGPIQKSAAELHFFCSAGRYGNLVKVDLPANTGLAVILVEAGEACDGPQGGPNQVTCVP